MSRCEATPVVPALLNQLQASVKKLVDTAEAKAKARLASAKETAKKARADEERTVAAMSGGDGGHHGSSDDEADDDDDDDDFE